MYKPYNVLSKLSKLKIPELIFVQDEVNNLDKYMKLVQSPVKITSFYLPFYYKSLQPNRKQDMQYWNEITIKFLKQKHNADTTRCGFPIEMYIGEPPSYKLYFITLTLQDKIIIGPINKMVTLYVIKDLVLLD